MGLVGRGGARARIDEGGAATAPHPALRHPANPYVWQPMQVENDDTTLA